MILHTVDIGKLTLQSQEISYFLLIYDFSMVCGIQILNISLLLTHYWYVLDCYMPRGGGDRVLINTASLFPPIISSFYNSLLYYCRDFYIITRACTDQGVGCQGWQSALDKGKGIST